MAFNFLHIIVLFLLTLYTEGSSNSTSSHKVEDNVAKEYLAARQVYVYRAYKDMQIFHFSIPLHTSNSVFNLTSNNTGGCSPRNITVYLQAESYPVVSPDGANFPETAWTSRQQVYQATLFSDLTPTLLTIGAPQPGDWFMVAFIFDDSNRITQAGLFPSCYAWLQVEASYYIEKNVEIIETQVNEDNLLHASYEIDKTSYYSFFIPPYGWSAKILIKCRLANETNRLENLEDTETCPLMIIVRPLALPFVNAPDSVGINCSKEEFENCSLPFTPMPGAWHYVSIIPSEVLVSFDIGVSVHVCGSNEETLSVDSPYLFLYEEEFIFKEIDLQEKLKDTFTKLNTSLNSSSLTEMTISPEQNSLFNREEKEIILEDFETPISNDIENSNTIAIPVMNFRRFLQKRSIQDLNYTFLNETETPLKLSDVVKTMSEASCWPIHQLTRKTFPGNFVYEFDFKPNVNGSIPLMLNLSNHIPTILNFNVQSIIDIGGTLSVDFALSPFINATFHNYSVYGCLNFDIRASVDIIEGEFKCSSGRLMSVNTSSSAFYSHSIMIPYPEPGSWFLSLFPSCYLKNKSIVPCSTNVTTVIFSIASASCVNGKCGDYGSCFQYISGGFIFSTCVCDVGYRGYDCSDGSEAISNRRLLVSTLLLCLSNLFFLPAVFLALYRSFYTEALIYAFTMFFSTFYHACDQDIYNFCLMRLSVLQFCDFYSAILSFWVTLIVMANLPSTLHSILHMAGAVIVALGVEYDRTGLWVFAVPSISAFFIMAIAWIIHTKKEKSCYPPRKYWVRSLLPGTILATTGLICYAFLETEDNYYIIHSVWHSIMALSILCLLPPKINRSGDSLVEEVDFQTSDAQALTVNLNL